MRAQDLATRARTARRESQTIEFKEQFHPQSAQAWCELIKDIVAMANSGGGAILIGVLDNGAASGSNVEPVLALDPAQIADKITPYVGETFDHCVIEQIERDGKTVAALFVSAAEVPFVFIRPGTYPREDRKQGQAFVRGSVYFRHGAKSEPGTTNDLRRALGREVERVRKAWLKNIRKVAEAPTGAVVQVYAPGTTDANLLTKGPFRLVDDPAAPAIASVNPDDTHPYRMKELLRILNDRIDNGRRLTTHDMQCIRKAHGIDAKPEFLHRGKFTGAPQYSDAFVDWLVRQQCADAQFFEKARSAST